MRLSSKLLFEIEGDAIIIQNGEHDAAQWRGSNLCNASYL